MRWNVLPPTKHCTCRRTFISLTTINPNFTPILKTNDVKDFRKWLSITLNIKISFLGVFASLIIHSWFVYSFVVSSRVSHFCLFFPLVFSLLWTLLLLFLVQTIRNTFIHIVAPEKEIQAFYKGESADGTTLLLVLDYVVNDLINY